MKDTKTKLRFIELRAGGMSYDHIAQELKISKSTCTDWAKELHAEIADRKKNELDNLYECYGLEATARIKRLGETLQKIDAALDAVDWKKLSPRELLELKLKYIAAIKKEYVPIREPDKTDDLDIFKNCF
jgi:transposase